MVKGDGSVLIHSDGGSYKPLNWMSPPCTTRIEPGVGAGNTDSIWVVENKAGEQLQITVHEIYLDTEHDLGVDPGLQKDGVEAQLQALLATHVGVLGPDWTLIRREYPTAIGPVDLLCRDGTGVTVAVEIKRRGDIDGVEQLTRYLAGAWGICRPRDQTAGPDAGGGPRDQMRGLGLRGAFGHRRSKSSTVLTN